MDREEEQLRNHRLKTLPVYKNFKEGIWESPTGKRIEAVATYEATGINITILNKATDKNDATYSIGSQLWDVLFDSWKFIEPYKGAY